MSNPASTVPTRDDLVDAVKRSSEAYARLKLARANLHAFEDQIRHSANVSAEYRPTLYYMKGHAEHSAVVAIEFAHYAVAAGEVHRIRVANPSLC